jgi:hypothetical protein
MRVRSARSGERAGGSQALDRYCSGLLLLLVRSTPLRAGLRREVSSSKQAPRQELNF